MGIHIHMLCPSPFAIRLYAHPISDISISLSLCPSASPYALCRLRCPVFTYTPHALSRYLPCLCMPWRVYVSFPLPFRVVWLSKQLRCHSCLLTSLSLLFVH